MRIAHMRIYGRTAYMAMSAFLRSDKGGKAGQPATSSKLHCKATLQGYFAWWLSGGKCYFANVF